MPLALAILAAMYFLLRHRRRAHPLGEKAAAGDGAWTGANHGDAERHNELSTEGEYSELATEGYRPAELGGDRGIMEAGGWPIMEIQ